MAQHWSFGGLDSPQSDTDSATSSCHPTEVVEATAKLWDQVCWLRKAMNGDTPIMPAEWLHT